MRHPLRPLLLLILLLAPHPARTDEDGRRFAFTYQTEIGPVPAGAGPVHVFVPLPAETPRQTVESLEITAGIPGVIETEPVYGNRFWHGSLPEGRGEPIEVTLEAVVVRRAASGPTPASAPLGEAERAFFLGPNRRVAVGHPMLEPILAEIRAEAPDGDPAATGRAIYDWVVDNVTYKKVGTGWGNGDTFWACSERYGNCTDFHALFVSLARTEGIPARFEMGFPVPDDRAEGSVGGYHCWVEFHVAGTGWVPIDASEASKHPEKRELFYGGQPPDRIHFTPARDLRLGPDHRTEPLNYFVYPHVEVGRALFTGPIERRFAFAEAGAGPGANRKMVEQAPVREEDSGG